MLKTILKLKLKSLQAQLAYPANFMMQVVSIALIGFLGIPALLLLTTAFPSIGGWDFYMLGFMAALREMAGGIHHGFFFSFFYHRELVKSGRLDRLLVRPVHPLLQIMASSFDLSAIGGFVPGLVLFAITCRKVAVEWNILNVAFLAIVVLSGAIIEWAVYLFFATFDFWLEGVEGLGYIPDAFRESTLYYPIHIYSRALAYFITFCFPYAFIAYFPTLYFFQVNVETFPGFFVYLTPVVAVLSTAIVVAFWSFGLRHYQSTGT
ncbi:MAG: ABC-2 family transporter protein [Anaerolineae bacterium]|nr:ABC-2 family transporter protein [Anaerolineae bacterium]